MSPRKDMTLPKYGSTTYHSQSVASPVADSGIVSSVPARSHTFLVTDFEIFSAVILLLLLIQEGLVSVTSESM